MENLTEAKVSYTTLQEIKPISVPSLSKLVKLDLSHNQITQILRQSACNGDCDDEEEVAATCWASLRELNLSDNRLAELCSWQFDKFTSLEVLDLSNNRLAELKGYMLSNLGGLKELRLSGNGMFELRTSSHRPLENLTILDASNNSLTELNVNFFSKLTKLEVLDLSHNRIRSLSESHFKELTNLKRLCLNSNGLRVLEDNTFRSMILNYLDLSNNILSTIAVSAFQNLHCAILKLRNSPRMDMVAFHKALLHHLRSVEELDLSSSMIHDRLLASEPFAGLEHSLKRLNLSNNLLTQAPKLSEFIQMQVLDLSKNPIQSSSDPKATNGCSTSHRIFDFLAVLVAIIMVLMLIRFVWPLGSRKSLISL